MKTERPPEYGVACDEITATPRLLTHSTFIDLRAPVEFARGAIPGAVNLPLLNDAEREQIGLTYAGSGQAAAIALGYRLVTGAKRTERVAAWLEFARAHPETCLYCARGGLRSAIAQAWIRESGLHLPRVRGGFKALRNLCIRVLQREPPGKRMLLIGGYTGAGKTELIRRSRGAIDLEALANHRGSAFGARDTPQPATVDFENALAVASLNHQGKTILLEDESRSLGRRELPEAWYRRMQASPLLLLESDLASRCLRIEREYVRDPLDRGVTPEALVGRLTDSLQRIRRRLGGPRHAEVARLLREGFRRDEHTPWIERLLAWYYDPMYAHQLDSRRALVLGRGDAQTVLRLIEELDA